MALTIAGLIAGVAVIAGLVSYWPERSVIVWDRGESSRMPRVLSEIEIGVVDIPAVAAALTRSAGNGDYAAIAFNTPDQPNADQAVNLNLTIENGKVGLDWVLLGSRNIADEVKFTAFARSKGIDPEKRVFNDVTYLRVENTDVAEFSASVIRELYNMPDDTVLGLYHEGFGWPVEE